jgi:hypothetical protein
MTYCSRQTMQVPLEQNLTEKKKDTKALVAVIE